MKFKMIPVVTPPLMLKYAWLTKPDETYKKYSVNIIGKREEDPKLDAFLTTLEKTSKELVGQMLKEQDPKKLEFIQKNYKLTMPHGPEMFKYEPTGFLVMKARSNAEHKPKVFCTVDGKVVPTDRPVLNGSVGEVKCLLNPYISDSQKTYGCSLLLQAVNIHKFGAGGAADSALITGFSVGENAAPEIIAPPSAAPGDF